MEDQKVKDEQRIGLILTPRTRRIRIMNAGKRFSMRRPGCFSWEMSLVQRPRKKQSGWDFARTPKMAEQVLKMTWQVLKMKMEAVLAITVQAMAMKTVRH